MNKLNILLIALLLSLSVSCSVPGNKDATSAYTHAVYQPQFAGGMQILTDENRLNKLLRTINPWQGSDTTNVQELMIIKDGSEVPDGFKGQVLRGKAKRIACMSSTHIAMLDAIGCADRVVAVSGLDYISNPIIQANRNDIADVGYEGNVDYEKLLATKPDIVILYGIGGASPMEPKLKELGIPFVYVGEYTEESPLGKAEWMVFIGEIADKSAEAINAFNQLPTAYNNLKKLAETAKEHPTVMLNTPYQDQWMMPPIGCYAVTLIRDAGGKYLYNTNNSDRSQPIDMEKAWLLTSEADYWLNVGQIGTMWQLMQQLPRFKDTKPVKNGNVWNSTMKTTPAGGNDYWESGVVHPDLVLQDLIKILHPGMLTDRPFTYYKRLE